MTRSEGNLAIEVRPSAHTAEHLTTRIPPRFFQYEETVRRVVLLSVLYLVAGLQALVPVTDPDIWWHLRTGQWIVEHAAVPVTDPFSAYGLGKPWIAYSWLFEVLVYEFYQAFGLLGIVLYTVTLSLLIAVALHRLVRRYCLPFTSEIALVALGLVALKPLLSPRPWLFTILFFILELDILLAVRRSGDARRLVFLPLLFLLWANLHIQFVYGLFVLGVFAAEPLIEQFLRGAPFKGSAASVAFVRRLSVVGVCAAVTLITPYHLDLYRTAVGLMTQSGPFNFVSELQALSFRALWDWFILGTILGATFWLGGNRERRPLPLVLLGVGVLLAFRVGRDAWFVIIVSIAFMAEMFSAGQRDTTDLFPFTPLRMFLVAGVATVAFLIVSHIRGLSEDFLKAELARRYPVAAAAEVEARGYAGPLYNDFNWGGYLIWRLPHLPVSMDGRTNVYGDKRIERSLRTWSGEGGWAADPDLTIARLVIAPQNSGWTPNTLTSLLRLDPRFEVVHEDEVAAVFVAVSPQEHDAAVQKDAQ